MAEESSIEQRLKKFSTDSPAVVTAKGKEAEAKAAVQAASELETKSFLDTLSDPESIMTGVGALGALLAGSPGAAAFIAGMDVLGSPAEMEASKSAKAGAQASAAEAAVKATDKVIDAQKQQYEQEVKQALDLREEFLDNPLVFTAAMQAKGLDNDQISASMLIKPGTMDWDVFVESTKKKQTIDMLKEQVIAAMGEADNTALHTSLAKDLLKLNLHGVDIKEGDMDKVIENVGKAGVTFDEIISPIAEAVTPMSAVDAAQAHQRGADSTAVTNLMQPRMSTSDYDQEQDAEDMAARRELEAVRMSLVKTRIDPTTGKVEILQWPDTQTAIDQMPTEDYKILARERAHEWGHEGTAIEDRSAAQELFIAMEAVRLKTNIEREDADLDSVLFPQLPPEWTFNAVTRGMQDARKVSQDAVSARVMRDIKSLQSALKETYLVPGTTGYEAAAKVARESALAVLGPGDHDQSKINATAAQLVKADPQKYAKIGADALGVNTEEGE